MPAKAPTPCLTCGSLGRCDHRRREVRSTHAWTLQSREIRRRWVARHGWWCPGYGPDHPPHESHDLTVHHLDPLASTGHDTGEHMVLCRAMNARLGAAG